MANDSSLAGLYLRSVLNVFLSLKGEDLRLTFQPGDRNRCSIPSFTVATSL
jgi:hypothetical protein